MSLYNAISFPPVHIDEFSMAFANDFPEHQDVIYSEDLYDLSFEPTGKIGELARELPDGSFLIFRNFERNWLLERGVRRWAPKSWRQIGGLIEELIFRIRHNLEI